MAHTDDRIDGATGTIPEAAWRHVEAFANVFGGPVLCSSPDFRIVWVNPGFSELTGFALSEIVGLDPKQVLDLELLSSPTVTENRKRLTTGRHFRGPITFRAKDGRRFSLKWEAHPVQNESGEVVGYVGFEANRSEREELDASISDDVGLDATSRFRSLVEAVPVAVWERLVEADVFTYVSPSTSQFGYPLDAWYTPGFRSSIIDASDLPAVRSACEHAVATMQPCELEYRLEAADGTVRWVHEATSAPEPSDRGLLVRCVVHDVTARVVNEQNLRSAKEALEVREAWVSAILAAEPEGVQVIDPAFRIVKMNDAGLRMLQVPDLQRVRGADVRRFVSEATLHEFEESVRTAFEGRAVRAEFEITGAEGGSSWVEQHAVMIEDPAPGADGTYVLAVLRDITARRLLDAEREAARAAAAAASRAKSDFMANMSHEMRTPLTAVVGFADLALDTLTRDDLDVAQVRSAIETIRRAGVHLSSIVEDILDMGRIETGLLNVDEVPTNVAHLMNDIVQFVGTTAVKRGLSVQQHIDSSVPTIIMADATRVRQILLNLTANSLKLTTRGGLRLDVTSERRDDGQIILAFEVTDTGPGVALEHRAAIFERFHQLDATATRVHGGLGLGLSISRGLARLLGGDVVLLQSDVGIGSRFRLSLPVRLPPALQDVPPTSSEEVAPSSAALRLQGRVLVAEDGEDNRILISSVLSRSGADVHVAEDGVVALAMFDEAARAGRGYDLLITDIQMPNLDGIALARTLRARGERLPIVALTALASGQDRAACLAAGCDDFAPKPISRFSLLEVTQRALTASESPASASRA